MSFNSMLVGALYAPLFAASYKLSDGSPIYNGLADDRCLFYYMSNFFKKGSRDGKLLCRRKSEAAAAFLDPCFRVRTRRVPDC